MVAPGVNLCCMFTLANAMAAKLGLCDSRVEAECAESSEEAKLAGRVNAEFLEEWSAAKRLNLKCIKESSLSVLATIVSAVIITD